jgi:signal transduction histidine kinase
VRELSSAVHALAHQFHPVALERAGLVGAVRGLCREWSCRQEFDVEYVHSDLPEGTPPAAVLCLYRVAQEALRNAARHSGAGRVAVALGTVRGQVRLTVQDDGVGFDPAAARGLGLISMRERLDLVGGRLAVDAAPGRGTRIRATVPVGEPTPFRHEVGSR